MSPEAFYYWKPGCTLWIFCSRGLYLNLSLDMEFEPEKYEGWKLLHHVEAVVSEI